MKINVEGVNPIFKKKIIDTVEKIDGLNCRYLDGASSVITTVVFEVQSEDTDYCIATIKKAIKNTEEGKMMLFRVIPNGSIVYFHK